MLEKPKVKQAKSMNNSKLSLCSISVTVNETKPSNTAEFPGIMTNDDIIEGSEVKAIGRAMLWTGGASY